MPLVRRAEPFTHPDWLFEIKWDGFRSLAHIQDGQCRLVSRNGNDFMTFPALNFSLPVECRARRAVLDGEIVCLDDTGRSQFRNLLFRRGEPRFYAFDLLYCDGEDLRYLRLEERKHRLRSVLPRISERLLYCDHVELAGAEFFEAACEGDLEGIVAKRKFDPYLVDGSGSGTRSGTVPTRNGQGGRNYLSASEAVILIGRVGTCAHPRVMS
jgi:bifunctional non-homologous end joining protein LigD